MKLSEVPTLDLSGFCRAVSVIQKPQNLEYLLTLLTPFQERQRRVVQDRLAELLGEIPQGARFSAALNEVVAKATGCSVDEARRALNSLQEKASRRKAA